MSEAAKQAIESDDLVPPGMGQQRLEPNQKRRVLDGLWHPFEWPSLEPQARRWLVVMGEGGDEQGVIPLGKVGLLAGAGGAGKSFALSQLAVAVATGHDWLGFRVASPGRVLLVLGEEEGEEARRRMYRIGEAMKLSKEARDEAAKRMVVLPMAGENVALTESLDGAKEGRLPVTQLLEEIEERLRGDEDWALVVLDPLSRFAGADVETDNAAATRFVQVLERLAKAPGGPTVLVSHHTNKTARREGAGESDAAAATALRGASGLTDGVRWQANLEAWERIDGAPRLLSMRVVKSNYGPPVSATDLTVPAGGHGTLRMATDEERKAWAMAKEAKKASSKKGEETRSKSDTEAARPSRTEPIAYNSDA